MNLFMSGTFTSHAGLALAYKIECDTLVEADWNTLAKEIVRNVPLFGQVIGVPRGGLRLARVLESYCQPEITDVRLIVDDVLTTGASMVAMRQDESDIGYVVFARGPCPTWVKALFYTGESVQPLMTEAFTVGRTHI